MPSEVQPEQSDRDDRGRWGLALAVGAIVMYALVIAAIYFALRAAEIAVQTPPI
jgi:hypothetical protein